MTIWGPTQHHILPDGEERLARRTLMSFNVFVTMISTVTSPSV